MYVYIYYIIYILVVLHNLLQCEIVQVMQKCKTTETEQH